MYLNMLRPPDGSRKKRKKVGRGDGSGHGGTSCKGHKGQRARSGSGIGRGSEGGQMPLQRRLPKRGFRNIFKKEYTIIHLKDINLFENESVIGPTELKERGLLKAGDKLVKILSDGEVSRAVTVKAHKFSKRSIEKIEAAGGKAEVI
ncbi:MAG: 50S ribosomal protein L15 [bacterium]